MLSRQNVVVVRDSLPGYIPEDGITASRYLEVITYGLCVISVYVPNGNQRANVKPFQNKMAFLHALTQHLRSLVAAQEYSVIVGGDLNIAPTELDVDSEEWWKSVGLFVTEDERSHYERIMDIGFYDVVTACQQDGNRVYTSKCVWGRGLGARAILLRIDAILVPSCFLPAIFSVEVQSHTWMNKLVSDHCPVKCVLILTDTNPPVVPVEAVCAWDVTQQSKGRHLCPYPTDTLNQMRPSLQSTYNEEYDKFGQLSTAAVTMIRGFFFCAPIWKQDYIWQWYSRMRIVNVEAKLRRDLMELQRRQRKLGQIIVNCGKAISAHALWIGQRILRGLPSDVDDEVRRITLPASQVTLLKRLGRRGHHVDPIHHPFATMCDILVDVASTAVSDDTTRDQLLKLNEVVNNEAAKPADLGHVIQAIAKAQFTARNRSKLLLKKAQTHQELLLLLTQPHSQAYVKAFVQAVYKYDARILQWYQCAQPPTVTGTTTKEISERFYDTATRRLQDQGFVLSIRQSELTLEVHRVATPGADPSSGVGPYTIFSTTNYGTIQRLLASIFITLDRTSKMFRKSIGMLMNLRKAGLEAVVDTQVTQVAYVTGKDAVTYFEKLTYFQVLASEISLPAGHGFDHNSPIIPPALTWFGNHEYIRVVVPFPRGEITHEVEATLSEHLRNTGLHTLGGQDIGGEWARHAVWEYRARLSHSPPVPSRGGDERKLTGEVIPTAIPTAISQCLSVVAIPECKDTVGVSATGVTRRPSDWQHRIGWWRSMKRMDRKLQRRWTLRYIQAKARADGW